MVAGLDLGVFGAALATLLAQGISAVFSLLIFFSRMRRYKRRFEWFDRHELRSMLRIAVPSVLQQSTVSIGMRIVQAVVNPVSYTHLDVYKRQMVKVQRLFAKTNLKILIYRTDAQGKIIPCAIHKEGDFFEK